MSQETPCCYGDESSESSSDKRTISTHSVVQGSISNPIQCRAAAEPRLHLEGVKGVQLESQALKERLCTVEEQNKVLSANKGRRKQDHTVSEDILAFGAELKICMKQYGLTINMFPPPAALLKVTLPNPVPPFNTAARYATIGLQETTTLAKLYNTLPQHLHHLVPMNHFSHVFSKVLCAGHASKLKKLRSAAGQIFELPQHYFAISHTRDMEPEIRQLLGITGKARNIIDRSCKTLFGNWQPIAKTLSCCLKGRTSLSNQGRRQGGAPPNAVKWGVTAVTPGAVAWAIVTNIFLLSPDQEFPQEGKGKTSRINYDTVFAFFKELLICNWEKPCLKGIIKNINNFVLNALLAPLTILIPEIPLKIFKKISEAGDSEDMSDDEEGDKNSASIDVLTRVTGTITTCDPDEAPVPPGPLTVSSNSNLITGSSPCVYDGPGDETEVLVIEETDIQPVKTKSKAGRRPKKSKAVPQEGDVIDSGPAAAPRRSRSKK
ncbi:hypothetical protein EV702DRAFT_1046154 [Suillus placidus]|uniref:Uncharacterized protein n=1 Tax=Suillus placidus TaxID=48579 RepID=A0A9P6ZTN2_9AGAM|nr:hypothetical protein EV702DRAFT_1046154 [Suillus placidus]